MKLFFCEKCGKRVTDRDLASGEALDKQVKGVHCKDCAEGVMTMTFEALTESQAKALVQKAPVPGHPTSVPAVPAETLPAPISSSRAAPLRAPARDSHPRRTVLKPEEANATPWIAAAAVGLAITVVCTLVLLKGSAAPAKPVASAGAKTAEASSEPPPSPWDSNAPEASPDDSPEVPAAPVPPAVPARTPAPAPAAPAKPAPPPADAPPRAEKLKPSPIGPDGLLIHLTFDGDVNDSGPLKLEAKARTAPAFEAGIHGQAYVTKDGSKDNTLVLDRKKALYDLDQFTIACWVRVDKTAPRGSTLILNHMRWSVSVGAKGFGV
ncbi:MAG: hypothetical protein KIS92_26115, partial [Planctomycetota bacterium]|nr:hypothetical protein [Planctomycetota bacterium]